MKKNKLAIYICITIFGALLFAGGLVLLGLFPDGGGILDTLPFVCIGLGAGLFGSGLSSAIHQRRIQKNPQQMKQQEIENKDERNIAMRNKAKASSYDLMIIVYAALLLAFALMPVPLYVPLILVGAYLLFVGAQIYFLIKYQKEM